MPTRNSWWIVLLGALACLLCSCTSEWECLWLEVDFVDDAGQSVSIGQYDPYSGTVTIEGNTVAFDSEEGGRDREVGSYLFGVNRSGALIKHNDSAKAPKVVFAIDSPQWFGQGTVEAEYGSSNECRTGRAHFVLHPK